MKFNKKGITLVETILTILMLSIVLTAIGVALSSYGGQYKNMTFRLKAQESASMIAEKIELSVRYAGAAIINDSDLKLESNMIISKNGKLTFVAANKELADEEEYVETASYNGFNCNVIFTKYNDYSVNAEIIIYKGSPTGKGTDEVPSNDYLYKVTRTIKLLNTSDKSKIVENSNKSHIFRYK